MKYYATFLLIFLSLSHFFAQAQLSPAPHSPFIYVYQLDETEAEKLVSDSRLLPDTSFLHSKVDSLPFTTHTDALHVFEEKLRSGYYLFVRVEAEKWTLQFRHVTKLKFAHLAGLNQTLLYVNKPEGETALFYEKEKLSWSPQFQAFILPGSKHKGVITVQTAEEKAFYCISHPRHSKTISTYTWSAQSGSFRPYSRPSKPSFKGYIVTNQPKYLPGDTVRLKAFVLRKNGKPFTQPLILYLRDARSWQESKRMTLLPVTPGAYVGLFPLTDSLPLDKKYKLVFRREKNYRAIALPGGEFSYEDYQLKNVTYLLTSTSSNLTADDDLILTATATDANGQPAPDTRLEMRILLGSVITPPDSSLYLAAKMADTTALIEGGKWTFTLPATKIPDIAARYTVFATFINSENERRDTLLLFQIKAPEVKKDPKTTDEKPLLPTPELTLTGHRTADSVTVTLSNPAGITAHYQWWKGKILLKEETLDSNLQIALKDESESAYRFAVNYLRDGQSQTQEVILPLFTQTLKVEIALPEKAAPGEKVPVTITVRDYENKPVSDVNLTALTVSNQFEENHVPDPPYLSKNSQTGKNNPTFSISDYRRKAEPRLSQPWLRPMGLDTMVYYRLKYPDSLYLHYEPIPHFLPQFSPYIYKDGARQPITLIWLDGQPVYYAGVQVSQPYSFVAEPGYHTLTLRTQTAEYTLPGIWLSQGFKLEISLNEENLPKGIYKLERAGWFTEKEAAALNRSLIKISSDYRPEQKIYLWQSRQVFSVNNGQGFLAGPFTLYEPLNFRAVFPEGEDKHSLPLIPGYHYLIGKDLTLLEKEPMITTGTPMPYVYNRVQAFGQIAFVPGDILRDSMPAIPIRNTSSAPDHLKVSGEYRLVYKHISDIRYFHLQRYGDNHNVWTLPASNQKISDLSPGIYQVTVENHRGEFANLWSFEIKEDYIFFDYRDTILFEPHYYFAHNITNPHKITPDGWFLNEAVQFGKDTLRGTVNNAETGAAIRDAKVILYAEGKQIMGSVTDADGRFIFPNIYARSYEFLVLKKGYALDFQPAEWQKGKPVKLSVKPVLSGKIDSLKAESVIQKVPRNFYGQTNYFIDGVSVREVSAELEGKTAGVVIRGVRSISGSSWDKEAISGNSYFSGYVYDPEGQPILGAVVMISGTTRGTITDQNGFYRLGPLPVGEYELNFSFIGFNRLQQKLFLGSGQTKTTNVSLDMSNMALDEVVVTGYGVRKRISFDVKKAEKLVLDVNSFSWNFGDGSVATDSLANTFLPDLRSDFADCAAWEPNLITGADGTAAFTLTFPDNITTWNTYALAMNGQRQSGYGQTSTQVSRPVIARLGMPRFALVGDSLSLTGRVVNYTGDSIAATTTFTVDSRPIAGSDTRLKDFRVESAAFVAGNGDSLKIAYQTTLANGYSDGEQRFLPLLPVGLEEHKGSFHYLEGDTTLRLAPDPTLGPATLQIWANPLDVLLEDLEWLKRYPYECNEQLASKLIAWAQEKKIRQILNQPFDHEITLQNIKRKLLRNRNDDGSWGWWANGSGDVWMTAYITRALLLEGEEKEKLTLSAEWLLSRLFTLGPDESLHALLTLSEMYPVLRFPYELEKAEKLANRPYHQLLIARIRQNQGLPVDMEKFWADSHTDISGGKYWGPESWYWYGGGVEMTTLAYEVLRDNGHSPEVLAAIRNYLLRVPHKNTVETARILSVVLPDLAAASASLDTKTTISLQNQELIKDFPVKKSFAAKEEIIRLQKTGLQPVFVSLTQSQWNPQPPRRDSLFDIRTSLVGEEGYISQLKAGEKAWIRVNVEVNFAGEYLMLQVPIPAGCSYGEKKQAFPYADHAEYYKDRVNLYFTRLPEGNYTFDIELEPRYEGNYTLNPAQMEMMYAPAKNGNNEARTTAIR
ncbi:MAG: carboxypeptidase-like regulatory domain-containing protein [Bacteroidia bacterium]|nr:carboxypeptidase-like regulatory domain-containing protein [Bacteroidia bacterium]